MATPPTFDAWTTVPNSGASLVTTGICGSREACGPNNGASSAARAAMWSAPPPPISDGWTLCGMPSKEYRSLGIWASAAPASATALSILMTSVTGVLEVGSAARVAGHRAECPRKCGERVRHGATTVVVTVTGGGGGTGAAATVGAGAGGLASDAGTVGAGGATFDSDAGGADSGSAVFDSVLGVVPASSPEFDPPVPVPSCSSSLL